MKLILLTILAHLMADFTLQGWFSNAKQKAWWMLECKKFKMDFEDYKNDYKVALFLHSLYWSIIVLLPSLFLSKISDTSLLFLLVFNTVGHYIVDNEKANNRTIDLFFDQLFHFIQLSIIVLTALAWR